MARDRQRAKQRQAERRARRLAQQGDNSGPAEETRSSIPGIQPAPVGPGIDPNLAAGAPPQDEGRSDTVLEHEQELEEERAREEEPLSETEALQEIEDWEVEDETVAEPTGAGEAGYEARGRRGRQAAEAHKQRPRVIQFLISVWAELQRVQWPNRQALITLTGVVLGFVLIAGGYLGLLDAIFSELIKAIL